MAKEGIDSFLLDCHTNENLSEIEASFGIKGFAVIVRLWQKIYSEKGYYCEWIERSPLLFLANWFGGNSGVDLNLIKEVIITALRIGIFNQELYEKYSILTSEGIQKRYFDVVKRRTELTIINEYLLVSVDNFRGIVNKKSIFADKNAKNVCKNETSKVKKRKGKESKVESTPVKKTQEEKDSACISPIERFEEFWAAYPKSGNRFLTENEYGMAVISGIHEDDLVKAATNYAEYCRHQRIKSQFIKNPENFIKDNVFVNYTKGEQYGRTEIDSGTSEKSLNDIMCEQGIVGEFEGF